MSAELYGAKTCQLISYDIDNNIIMTFQHAYHDLERKLLK